MKELFEQVRSSRDELNQYSFPFGLPALRHAIADYTQACYGYRPDPEEQITVVLGASEGMAAAFRSLLDPGDGVVVMQPYHELYPSQAAIFGLVPRFVTLREDRRAGTWRLDRDELQAALSDPSVKAVVVNTPQNPTGKVLDEEELEFIAELCRAHDRFAITDEIYEHITFDGHRHRCLARCEGMAERTLVVNSISKTGRATGWRVGWVITPPDRTPALRAVHDNLVVQAPTPLQKGAVSLLRQPRSFFAGIAEGYREKRDLLVGGLRDDRVFGDPAGGGVLPVRGLPPRAGAGGDVADAGRHVSHREGGGGHGAGRQLLRHRTRGRALPAIRLLPLAQDAGGRHRTAPCRASLASGRARTGFAHALPASMGCLEWVEAVTNPTPRVLRPDRGCASRSRLQRPGWTSGALCARADRAGVRDINQSHGGLTSSGPHTMRQNALRPGAARNTGVLSWRGATSSFRW